MKTDRKKGVSLKAKGDNRAVYVDFDDVLCSTAESLLEILFQQYGKRISYENLTSFDLNKCMNITNEKIDTILDIAHSDEKIIQNDPVRKASEALSKLSESGYRIDIVTGRPPFTKTASETWLSNYHVPYDNLYFVNKYSRQGNGYGDGETLLLADIKQMNFSFAVEDSLDTAAFIARNMNIPVFLLDRPWNRTGDSDPNIRRCRGWGEIMENLPTA
jgi:uncharacterized HAD superfamily protein